jgi:hypothetical protein
MTKEGSKYNEKTRLNNGERKINRKQIIQDGMGRKEDKMRVLKGSKTPTRNANSFMSNTEGDKTRPHTAGSNIGQNKE